MTTISAKRRLSTILNLQSNGIIPLDLLNEKSSLKNAKKLHSKMNPVKRKGNWNDKTILEWYKAKKRLVSQYDSTINQLEIEKVVGNVKKSKKYGNIYSDEIRDLLIKERKFKGISHDKTKQLSKSAKFTKKNYYSSVYAIGFDINNIGYTFDSVRNTDLQSWISRLDSELNKLSLNYNASFTEICEITYLEMNKSGNPKSKGKKWNKKMINQSKLSFSKLDFITESNRVIQEVNSWLSGKKSTQSTLFVMTKIVHSIQFYKK